MGDIKNISSPSIRQLKGDYHVGDIYNTVHNYSARKRKIQFDAVTAGMDAFNKYPRPHFIDNIFEKVKTESFVLIGGNSGFNKGQLLKFVALHLKTEGLEVKECADFSDFHNLSSAISEETNRSIFILYNLTAEAINYRFRELKSLVQKRDHIILSSTDNPYEAWLFHDGAEDPSWFQIPEKEIYSSETLRSYLEDGLQKKNLILPVSSNEIVAKLTKIEQLDYFIDAVVKSNGKGTARDIEMALEQAVQNDHADLEPWFYSLSNFNKLVVLGLAFFNNAYEAQVFAGFDRILEYSWKDRNKELRPIDYEDLIALKSYFKTEGKVIQGVFEHLHRKIIQIAWRTHKRYILTAIPVLQEIIYDSVNMDKIDLDLFGTLNHRTRIRNVISETLSIIGLLSFEDASIPLLLIASNSKLPVQIVTARAISKWKPFDEEKIFEVLELWQQETAVRLLEQNTLDKKDDQQRALLSNVRGAIALTLSFTSIYDKPNALSQRVKDLLLKFLHNNETAIITRMQFAVEHITERHPVSVKDILRNDFLLYDNYIRPVSIGLISAYNNGLSGEVKAILTEWLQYCRELKMKPEDRESFGHRESILSAIIFTLRYIDYNEENREITIREAYGILEDLRKNNHNPDVRKFLLDAIIDLIAVSFHSTEHVTINLISNIDRKEREYVVDRFRIKYLEQREMLTGGDFRTTFGDEYIFDTWSKAGLRPTTPIEKLAYEWKNGANDVLIQVGLQSILEFHKIETLEKELIGKFVKEQNLIEAKREQIRKEYEQKGEPGYVGVIGSSVETEAFVKICMPFIGNNQAPLLRHIYDVAVHEELKEEGIDQFIAKLDDKDEVVVKKVTFIFKLFRNANFRLADNPAVPSFQSSLFITLALMTVPYNKRKLLRALAPLLISASNLNSEEQRVVIDKIKPYNNGWLRLSLWFGKYPLAFFIACIICLIILYKIYNFLVNLF